MKEALVRKPDFWGYIAFRPNDHTLYLVEFHTFHNSPICTKICLYEPLETRLTVMVLKCL